MIHSALGKLVFLGGEKLPESILVSVRKKIDDKGPGSINNLEIRWRVLNWKMSSSDETRSLLSKAVSIFHVSDHSDQIISFRVHCAFLLPLANYSKFCKSSIVLTP